MREEVLHMKREEHATQLRKLEEEEDEERCGTVLLSEMASLASSQKLMFRLSKLVITESYYSSLSQPLRTSQVRTFCSMEGIRSEAELCLPQQCYDQVLNRDENLY